MFYKESVRTVRTAIKDRYPDTKPLEDELLSEGPVPLSHLLWMCDRIEEMNTTSIDDALKASRWIGWIFAQAEMRRFWTNKLTRHLIAQDRLLGFDKPHQR